MFYTKPDTKKDSQNDKGETTYPRPLMLTPYATQCHTDLRLFKFSSCCWAPHNDYQVQLLLKLPSLTEGNKQE